MSSARFCKVSIDRHHGQVLLCRKLKNSLPLFGHCTIIHDKKRLGLGFRCDLKSARKVLLAFHREPYEIQSNLLPLRWTSSTMMTAPGLLPW